MKIIQIAKESNNNSHLDNLILLYCLQIGNVHNKN